MKQLISLSFSLLSHTTSFIVTRPWLSGVTIVCGVLTLMMVGYGPKMDWEKKEELADEYLFLDDGFIQTDILPTPITSRKFELGKTENVKMVEKRPELSGPRFGGMHQSTHSVTNPFLQTAENDQQQDLSIPPTWSQHANHSNGAKQPQRPRQPSRVVSNQKTNQDGVLFSKRKGNAETPILKTSANSTASSAWLLGTIEDEPEPQIKNFKKGSSYFNGPIIIQGNRR